MRSNGRAKAEVSLPDSTIIEENLIMKRSGQRCARALSIVVLAVLCGAGLLTIIAAGPPADWPQWGRDPQHSSEVGFTGQNLNRIIEDVVYDPFVAQEMAENGGNLLVHYQVPLIDGNDVYMEFKSGNFTHIETWETQDWQEKRLSWQNGQLVEVWTHTSDWKPVPFASRSSFNGPFWEPVYHPVLAGDFIYVPAAGGTVAKLNKSNGTVAASINPFGATKDMNTFVAGPLSADKNGNVYYNAIKLSSGRPWDDNVVDSWLVKIAPNNTSSKVSFATLTPNAPTATDPCKISFSTSQLPWPPSPNAVPTTTPCGSQRPGINVAPAIAPDGTIYTVSRGHFVTRYNFLIAVNSNLTLKWNASLRGRLNDGCGVLLPIGGPGGCRAGATLGVDPEVNESGPGRVLDDGSSSPTVAPDGSVIFGAYTRYNWAQGHSMKFSSSGQFQGAYEFGWDITPGIYSHDGTYSIVIKDNHYGEVGSYCSVEAICPSDRTATHPNYPEEYFITQLNSAMGVDWKFKNTNTLSCSRDANGNVTCVNDHPNSFEWCVNAMAIDRNGVVYSNSEDGNLFAINQGGTLKQKIFQQLAVGAAYTPASIGRDGKIYSQNAGHLFVVGN
jgi:hypothetical protein